MCDSSAVQYLLQARFAVINIYRFTIEMPGEDGRIILKRNIKELDVSLEWIDVAQDRDKVMSCSEYDNEHLGTIKYG
jgi:hypothetical protein